MTRPTKDVGVAYLFCILLGGFGAHHFYLNQIGSGVAFLLIWWGGWLLSGIGIGLLLVAGAGIWWFIALFLIPGWVREANADIARGVA
jgi:TM2 domain-containing membrane protein YozV